jgi:hypothetical protein
MIENLWGLTIDFTGGITEQTRQTNYTFIFLCLGTNVIFYFFLKKVFLVHG